MPFDSLAGGCRVCWMCMVGKFSIISKTFTFYLFCLNLPFKFLWNLLKTQKPLQSFGSSTRQPQLPNVITFTGLRQLISL